MRDGTRILRNTVAVVFTLVGCANASSPASSQTDTPETRPLPSDVVNNPLAGTNWDNPIDNGVEVSSESVAQATVSFALIDTAALGAPDAVFVTGPVDEENPDRSVALIFTNDEFGRFDLIQAPAQLTPEEWAKATSSIVGDVGEPGYYGSATIDDLPDGATLLVTTSADKSISVGEFVDKHVDVTVIGPALTGDQATTIAETLTKS